MQGFGETRRVCPDLPLADQASPAVVKELDGILDCDDVAFPAGVDLVDHGRESRGLARARLAGDQDHSLALLAKAADHGRQAQFVDRLRLGRDTAHHRAGAADVPENVDPEPGDLVDRIGEISLVFLFVGRGGHGRGDGRQIFRQLLPVQLVRL